MRRIGLVILTLGLAGCMTGAPTDSSQSAVLDGNWVMAPEISERPMLAEEVPEGVDARPVDLVRTADGIVLVCDDGVPVSGFVDDHDGDDDGDSGLFHEKNAPEMGVAGSTDDGAQVGPDTVPAGDSDDASLDPDGAFGGIDIRNFLPVDENIWLIHAACL